MRRAGLRKKMKAAAPLAVLLAASQAGCTERKAASAEELLPATIAGAQAGADGAAVSAAVGLLARHAQELFDRAGKLPGGEQLLELRKRAAAQLGFDPLAREGLAEAGIDPDRGCALSLLPPTPGQRRPGWVLAVPVADAERFSRAVDRLLRERAGFTQKMETKRSRTRVTVFSSQATPERIAFAAARGYALLARSFDPAADVAAAAERKPDGSLAKDPGLRRAREQLGLQDFVLFAPAGSAVSRRLAARTLPGDLGLGMRGGVDGLAARLALRATPEQARTYAEAFPGGGAELAKRLAPSAPFKARLGASPAQLFATLQAAPWIGVQVEILRAAARSKGVDLEKDVLASLAPGVAVSAELSTNASLAEAIDYGLDWRRKSPFDTVRLVALARVADKPRLLRALDGLAQSLPLVSLPAVRQGDEWQVRLPAGAGARFGVRVAQGQPVAYFVGGDASLEQMDVAPAMNSPSPLLRDPGAALQLDLGALAASVDRLPESTYGSGPQSYVTRSLVTQVLEPLRPLRITLAASPAADGIGAELAISIASPAPSASSRP